MCSNNMLTLQHTKLGTHIAICTYILLLSFYQGRSVLNTESIQFLLVLRTVIRNHDLVQLTVQKKKRKLVSETKKKS